MGSLLIDAGNTRLKWGIADAAGVIVARGALPTPAVTAASLSAVGQENRSGLAAAMWVSVASDQVNQAIADGLASVVGERVERFLSTPQQVQLRNDYANPAQLGADRLAAALGAWQRVQGACLVVNCGTATTIDLVRPLGSEDLASNDKLLSATGDESFRSSRGESLRSPKFAADAAFAPQACFAGGVILPGLTLMKAALYRNTARLPNAGGRMVDAPAVPDNTDDAIASGCCLAQLGAIEAMHRRLPPESPIVLSGGAADLLLPHLAARGMTLLAAPELVLEGLAVAILHRFAS